MDQQRNQSRDKNMPNRASRMEKAEGSRENANAGESGGITNRPLDREQQEQDRLPDRGKDASQRDPAMPSDADPSLKTKI